MKVQRKQRKSFEQQYVYVAAVLLFAVCCAYMYFVSSSIVHVVFRKEIAKEVALLHSEISFLETEYINKQHAMSNEIASLEGFIVAKDKIFIDRADSSLVLSTNGIR